MEVVVTNTLPDPRRQAVRQADHAVDRPADRRARSARSSRTARSPRCSTVTPEPASRRTRQRSTAAVAVVERVVPSGRRSVRSGRRRGSSVARVERPRTSRPTRARRRRGRPGRAWSRSSGLDPARAPTALGDVAREVGAEPGRPAPSPRTPRRGAELVVGPRSPPILDQAASLGLGGGTRRERRERGPRRPDGPVRGPLGRRRRDGSPSSASRWTAGPAHARVDGSSPRGGPGGSQTRARPASSALGRQGPGPRHGQAALRATSSAAEQWRRPSGPRPASLGGDPAGEQRVRTQSTPSKPAGASRAQVLVGAARRGRRRRSPATRTGRPRSTTASRGSAGTRPTDSPAVIAAHDCSSGRITAKVSSPELGTTTRPAKSSRRTGSAPEVRRRASPPAASRRRTPRR